MSTMPLSDARRLSHGVTIDLIQYAGTDAFLVAPHERPPGRGPRAGVVYAHGGGATKDRFLTEAIELARLGALVLLPQTAFELSRDPERDLACIQAAVDVERRGLDVLADRVGDGRLGFVGHSWGSTQGAILAGTEPRLRTIVLAAPGARFSRFAWDWQGLEGDRAAYERVVGQADAVVHVVRPGQRAILVQRGREDPIPAEEVEELWAAIVGEKRREEYAAGHDLVGHAPARADRLAYLAKLLDLDDPAGPAADDPARDDVEGRS